jgi:hypothetical protein
MRVNSFGYALVSFILANRLPGQEGEQLCGLGRYFLCRHCHGLAYASQNEDKMARLNRKMTKPRNEVGDSSDDFISPSPEKPKGMHWETFALSRRTLRSG